MPDKKKENSGIAKDLQFIAEERNMLAHYFLDTSPDILSNFGEANGAFTLLKIVHNFLHRNSFFNFYKISSIVFIRSIFNCSRSRS